MIKILIIDDDTAFLNVLSTTLSTQDFQVFLAATGEEGVKLATSVHPDVILLDLILTDIPGLEVLRLIKKDEIAVSIPVVMLTSYGNDSVEAEADSLGLAGYLQKYKVKVEEIGPYVKNLLEKIKTSVPKPPIN